MKQRLFAMLLGGTLLFSYLVMPFSNGAAKGMTEVYAAKSLEEIQSLYQEGTYKVIYNDQLYIIRDGVIYDATGKKVRFE